MTTKTISLLRYDMKLTILFPPTSNVRVLFKKDFVFSVKLRLGLSPLPLGRGPYPLGGGPYPLSLVLCLLSLVPCPLYLIPYCV